MKMSTGMTWLKLQLVWLDVMRLVMPSYFHPMVGLYPTDSLSFRCWGQSGLGDSLERCQIL